MRRKAAMLNILAISNYRSLRDVVVPLKRLNLITGANGSGKSSLYRGLRLLADTAQGRVVPSLAREGGLSSTLWAGPERIASSVRRGEHAVEGTLRNKSVSLRLGFAGTDYGYLIDLGLPKPGTSAFSLDPQIKQEFVWHGPSLRPASVLADRKGALVRSRSSDDGWHVITDHLSCSDSMMSLVVDTRQSPELLFLRESIRAWRFYDHFRTDAEAPARAPQLGTYTPILANDGSDLAAAIQTIREIGDADALRAAVEDAFPKSQLGLEVNTGRFSLLMTQRGLLRSLNMAEVSDGTLRYLLWIAALLSPRPPEVMVLNEPETSLHPDLLPALSRLIVRASERCQMIVVSHARPLVDELNKHSACHSIVLEKDFGETRVHGLNRLNKPIWYWPQR
jgi:predicted ATPase